MPTETKSAREQVQDKIVEFLEAHGSAFDAPYGVLASLEPLGGKGKVRKVTFGVARYLDATVWIWSPTHLSVEARGSAARRFEKEDYASVDDFIDELRKQFVE